MWHSRYQDSTTANIAQLGGNGFSMGEMNTEPDTLLCRAKFKPISHTIIHHSIYPTPYRYSLCDQCIFISIYTYIDCWRGEKWKTLYKSKVFPRGQKGRLEWVEALVVGKYWGKDSKVGHLREYAKHVVQFDKNACNARCMNKKCTS